LIVNRKSEEKLSRLLYCQAILLANSDVKSVALRIKNIAFLATFTFDVHKIFYAVLLS